MLEDLSSKATQCWSEYVDRPGQPANKSKVQKQCCDSKGKFQQVSFNIIISFIFWVFFWGDKVFKVIQRILWCLEHLFVTFI